MKTKKTTLVLMLLAFGLVTSLFGQTTPYPTPTHSTNPQQALPNISRTDSLRGDYMTRYWKYIKKLPLNKFLMLGSHHATYDTDIVFCSPQTQSLPKQIQGGVRYGDVRFHFDNDDNTFYADHGSSCSASTSKFKETITSVLKSLGNNDLFIFHVKEIYNFSEGSNETLIKSALPATLNTVFGSEIITPAELANANLELHTATLEQLRAHGRIIVIAAQLGVKQSETPKTSDRIFKGTRVDLTLKGTSFGNIGNPTISYPSHGGPNTPQGAIDYFKKFLNYNQGDAYKNSINSLGFSKSGTVVDLPGIGNSWMDAIAEHNIANSVSLLQEDLLSGTSKGFILNCDGIELGGLTGLPGVDIRSSRKIAAILLEANIARAFAPSLVGDRKTFLENTWNLQYGWKSNYASTIPLALWFNEKGSFSWRKVDEFYAVKGNTPTEHLVDKPGYYYMVNKNSGFRSQIIEAKTLIRKKRSTTSDVIAHWSFNDNLKEYFSEELDLTERLNRYSFVTGKVKNAVRLKSGSLELKETMKISSGDFTISTWVRRHSLGGDSNILLGRYPNRGSITIGWDEEGRFEIFDEKTDGNTSKKFLQYGTSAKPAIPINTWVHVMVTRKGNAMKLFLNGVIVKEDTWKAGDNTLLMSAIRANGSTHTDFDEYKIHHTAHEVVPYFPIAHWTMDPLSPTTCCTSSLPDATGNGHTANIKGDDKVIHLGVNPISGINDAKVNGAIAWSEGVPKYFVLNSQIDLTNSFTIASWVKFIGSINNKDAIVGKNGPGNDINFHNGYPRLYNGSSDVVISKIAISNTWAHVAVTRDESNNLKIYVNGIETGTGNWSGTFTIKSIGAGNETPVKEGGNKYFDDLRIYNRALSAHEISILPGFSGSSSKRAKTKLLNVKEDAILSSINLYPNPATYAFSFTVPTEFKQSKVNVSISDISGKIVQSTILQNNNTNNLSVKTNTLSNGLYFVKIDIGDTSVTKKLLINK